MMTDRRSRIDPPATLAPPEQELWFRLLEQFDLQDEAALVLLRLLCFNTQLSREARAEVTRDGLMLGGKSHPLLGVIRDADKNAASALKALNLDLEPLRAVGRPSEYGAKGRR